MIETVEGLKNEVARQAAMALEDARRAAPIVKAAKDLVSFWDDRGWKRLKREFDLIQKLKEAVR